MDEIGMLVGYGCKRIDFPHSYGASPRIVHLHIYLMPEGGYLLVMNRLHHNSTYFDMSERKLGTKSETNFFAGSEATTYCYVNIAFTRLKSIINNFCNYPPERSCLWLD